MARKRTGALAPHREAGSGVVPIGGDLVKVDAIYHVPSVHPKAEGPWTAEADKVAWVDGMSGLACIIRRKPGSGVLGGYVAVPPGHPLFGWQPEALLGLGLQVHGGTISYAASCERTAPEEVSICHTVTHPVPEQRLFANDAALGLDPGDHGDDAWWFGFECDQPYDVRPGVGRDHAAPSALDGVNRREYRDMGYVHRECVRLAAQLGSIGEGRDPAAAIVDAGGAVGYDPRRARR